MSAFHCPIGATTYKDILCIDCGLCYVATQDEKVVASKRIREYLKQQGNSRNEGHGIRKIALCGKGGVGKSTITSLIALALKEYGYTVTVLDADESNPGLHRKLGFDKEPKPIFNLVSKSALRDNGVNAEWLQKERIAPHEIPSEYIIENDNIRYFMIGKIDDPLEGCACAMADLARDMLIKLSLKSNEVVLVDQEAGVENFGRGVERGADTILIVVEPSYESITLAEKIKYMSEGMGIRRIKAILNKIPSLEIGEKLTKQLEEKEISIIGTVYLNDQVSIAAFEGRPVSKSEAKDRVMDITRRMLDEAGMK